MREVSEAALLGDDCDEEVRKTVLHWLAHGYDVIKFQNQQMDSSAFGSTSYMKVGVGCTYEGVEDVEPLQHLNDLPSQRQYPVAFCRHEEEKP